jgi:hypothetical protein
MEPWGQGGVKQQTEADVILRYDRAKVFAAIECKLGRPGDRVPIWSRSKAAIPQEYRKSVESNKLDLFVQAFDYERHGKRYYQLMRNYILAAGLARQHGYRFALGVITNVNDTQATHSHLEELMMFRRCLVVKGAPYVFHTTWQALRDGLPPESLGAEYNRPLRDLRLYMARHSLLRPIVETVLAVCGYEGGVRSAVIRHDPLTRRDEYLLLVDNGVLAEFCDEDLNSVFSTETAFPSERALLNAYMVGLTKTSASRPDC